ncbi:hypothetical protein EVAR_29091_1 [Eumeta japonica]|uniref:Uncharacterized protein n=1 Tax=Eumeta variegata TaxID=151549 RepID=A0A4C1VMI5_EUMVA|nr:hypothetical protein EVAR_29091_1 [Eumeta japonica]
MRVVGHDGELVPIFPIFPRSFLAEHLTTVTPPAADSGGCATAMTNLQCLQIVNVKLTPLELRGGGCGPRERQTGPLRKYIDISWIILKHRNVCNAFLVSLPI